LGENKGVVLQIIISSIFSDYMAGLEAHSSQREDKQDEFECVKTLGNLAGFITCSGLFITTAKVR